MWFFRYTRFLEKENDYLKTRIESLEARNQELVVALSRGKPLSEVKPKTDSTKHSILTGDSGTSVSCSCGWVFSSDDPANLQQAVSNHYRNSLVKGGRKSFVNFKKVAENYSMMEELPQ